MTLMRPDLPKIIIAIYDRNVKVSASLSKIFDFGGHFLCLLNHIVVSFKINVIDDIHQQKGDAQADAIRSCSSLVSFRCDGALKIDRNSPSSSSS